jgi:chemotaxis protein MotB
MKVLSMARHKKHPEHENLERWLVSYADFITLLFATFTALYAIAQSKLTDDNKAADEIKKSFQQETLLKGIASVFQGQSTPTDRPNPAFEETGKGEGVVGKYESLILTHGEKKQIEELLEELDEVANELQQYIEQALSNPAEDFDQAFDDLAGVPLRGLEVTLQERGVKISFDSRLLFPSGSAELNKKSIRFLDQVASRLLKSTPTHLVHIEGHTDSSPITGRYPSNWELSSARACAVVRHFVNQHKFNPTDLAAIGYAESRPVTSNSSAKNRAKNRRIDIVLHSREQEQQVDPIPEARREKVLIDITHRYRIVYNFA